MANDKTNENTDFSKRLMAAAIEHMQDQANVYGEANIIEDAAYHKKMSASHLNWSAAHNSEVDNGGHEDHDYHAVAHDDAHDAHKKASDAFKKHGSDHATYKSAAATAHTASLNARDESSEGKKFKRTSKPNPLNIKR